MIRSSFQKAELWQIKEATIPNEPNFKVISDAVYTRQELFDLVWERPMTMLAEDIGVSTTTIRQTCTKYHTEPTKILAFIERYDTTISDARMATMKISEVDVPTAELS